MDVIFWHLLLPLLIACEPSSWVSDSAILLFVLESVASSVVIGSGLGDEKYQDVDSSKMTSRITQTCFDRFFCI